MHAAVLRNNSVFPTLCHDECGWDASGIRGTLDDRTIRAAFFGGRIDMLIEENWVDNDGIRINFFQSKPEKAGKTPLLICPGLSESAEEYINLISSLQDNRCIALSFRGRGKSDSPLTGYSLEDHVSDIAAVVKQLELDDFCLMGYSRGVSYALGYAIHNHGNIKGLIIEEYPAQHKQMPSGWGEEYLLSPWGERMNPHAVMGIELESRQIDFQSNLAKLDCSALIMRGGNEGSLLSDDDIKCYGRCFRDVRLEVFEDAGHDIQTEYFDRFVKVINAFLIELG